MSSYYKSLLGLSEWDTDQINADQIRVGILTAKTLIYPNGAKDGYILTSDPQGVASWKPDPNVNLAGDAVGPLLTNRIDTLAGGTFLVSNLVDLHTSQTLTNKTITGAFTGPLTGNADTVTTNANLNGDVTSVGNTTTVAAVGGSTAAQVHSAELAANAATSSNTANTIVKRDALSQIWATQFIGDLTGTATNFSGFLGGEVTGTQSATTLSNDAVISKHLTGFVSSSGTITASDTILQAIQKLDGNVTGVGTLSGEVTGPPSATVMNNDSVIKKVLTGYAAASGTITASDSILQALGKLSGNLTAATTDTAITSKLLTGYMSTTGTITATDSILQAFGKLSGNMAALTLSGDCSGSLGANTVTTLRGGTVTIPSGSDTVTTLTASQTLTNKNIIGTTNTIEATKMRNGTTWSLPFGGAAPTAGQLLGCGSGTTTWISPDATATNSTIALRTSTGGLACNALNCTGMTSTGAITGGYLNVGSGSITGGPVNCSTVSATGAITGASLNTGSGTISGGTITGTSLNTGTGNITGGSITGTSLSVGTGTILGATVNCTYLSATGSLTGASLNTGNGVITGGAITGTSLSAGSGNITGNNITGSGVVSGARLTTTSSIQAGNSNWSAPTSGQIGGGQGIWLGWNRSGGSGRGAFMNQQGGGAGGFEWLNYDSSGNLTANNPLMTLDASGNLTLGAGGIMGVTTNSSASAGQVGQVVSSGVASITPAWSVATDLTSITLTPGDWDIWGFVRFQAALGSYPISDAVAWINTVSATQPAAPFYSELGFGANGSVTTVPAIPTILSIPIPLKPVQLSSNTTFYLSAYQITVPQASNVTISGYMYARRVR